MSATATAPAVVWSLPRVLVADDGAPHEPIDGLPTGAFLRDLELTALITRATSLDVPWAVDLDTIRGLKADEAAAEFAVKRLGAGAVVSRRPAVVRAATSLGAVGLIAINAFDSTGLRRVAMAGPLPAGAGAILSPGLVLRHLRADELAILPRPLVGHGLIVRPADAIACLDQATAIVVRRDAARFLGLSLRRVSPSQRLTTVPIEE
jgi:glycerol-3-phosphate responsive antiterminator